MTDTRDVAYVRKRLCNASDLMSEVFVRVEYISKENIKLKKLLKECRGLMNYTKDWACTESIENLITKIDQVLQEKSNENRI